MNTTRALTLCSALALLGFVFLAVSARTARAADPVIVRVTTSGTSVWPCGDAANWSNACALQTALTHSVSPSELWVAAGTYTPTTADVDLRTATFQLRDGIALYGGFAMTETLRTQRNFTANVTILSGDLNGDDNNNVRYDEPTRAENAYHVVTGSGVTATAVLDGFSVAGGNANAADLHSYGGGMFTYGGSPTLNNLTLAHNSAYYYGGGMANFSNNPRLTNVTFISNTAYGRGGGMYNFDSSPELTNATFSGNSADSANGIGGGMINATGNPVLTNVTFSGNSASIGGGLHGFDSSLTLNNVAFISNTAPTGECGGLASGGRSLTLTNATFSGNSAAYGGGMCTEGTSMALTNVTFSSNTATWTGGGVENYAGRPTLTNVTFSANSAGQHGGGIYNRANSNPTLRNAIFWSNTAPSGSQIGNDSTSTANLSDSVVQGGCPSGITCAHFITADPLLGPLGTHGGSTQTIPLLPGSSAIDTGNDAVCPATDQRGVPRPQGAHCDIGAFEVQVTLMQLNLPLIRR